MSSGRGGTAGLLEVGRWVGDGEQVAAEGRKVLGAKEERREKLPQGENQRNSEGAESQQASLGGQRGGLGWLRSGKRPEL